MPTYDYECQKCGHSFEAFQSMKDDALKECPECGGELKRLIGAGAGIIFKGSGFYQTDYRSDSYRRGAKKDKPATKKGDSESSTKKRDGSEATAKKKTDSKGGE